VLLPSRAESSRGEAGSVTAEFAIALPAVLLVLVLCLTGVQAASYQLRVTDAAALAARSLSRGDAESAVEDRILQLLPGAALVRSESDGLVCATVSAASSSTILSAFTPTASSSSCSLSELQ
jgi:Flp pilus assembly protein TadG